MISDIDRQICARHRRHDRIEDAIHALRLLFRSAKMNNTWERDKTLQVYGCKVGGALHWHCGHK